MRNGRAAMMAEYRRELRKVLNRITKLQSEGYVIHERYIPKPKSEKNITEIQGNLHQEYAVYQIPHQGRTDGIRSEG